MNMLLKNAATIWNEYWSRTLFLRKCISVILKRYSFLEAYSECNRTSKKELVAKMFHGCNPVTVSATSSILDVWVDSEYTSAFMHRQQLRKFAHAKLLKFPICRNKSIKSLKTPEFLLNENFSEYKKNCKLF